MLRFFFDVLRYNCCKIKEFIYRYYCFLFIFLLSSIHHFQGQSPISSSNRLLHCVFVYHVLPLRCFLRHSLLRELTKRLQRFFSRYRLQNHKLFSRIFSLLVRPFLIFLCRNMWGVTFLFFKSRFIITPYTRFVHEVSCAQLLSLSFKYI